jgi:hypothetical protein
VSRILLHQLWKLTVIRFQALCPSISVTASKIRRQSRLQNARDFKTTQPFSLFSTSSLPSSSNNYTQLSSRRDSRASSKRFIFHEKKLVLLVMLLTLTTVASFGTAYYLITTSRWRSTLVLHPQQVVDSPSPQVAVHNYSLSYLKTSRNLNCVRFVALVRSGVNRDHISARSSVETDSTWPVV